MLEFLLQYKQLFITLAWGSLVLFFVSLAIIPWLVIKIPADYFHPQRRNKVGSKSRHPILALVLACHQKPAWFCADYLRIVNVGLARPGDTHYVNWPVIDEFPWKIQN